ncbi:MAG: GC-type dockerin domain-anchored protein [Planctomycetota bacterium]
MANAGRVIAVVLSGGVGGVLPTEGQSPYAAAVIAYDPAPGQFTGNPDFNDPGRAIGPPGAGTPSSPDNTGLVTLGGFGGSITLGFDHTVEDDPANPMGLDAIVFGNAFYLAGDPTRRFGEAGIIEISLDANGNGLADDPFYLIAGSGLSVPVQPPFELTAAVFTDQFAVNPNPETESVFGYADWTPTNAPLGASPAERDLVFTTPDDPFAVGLSEGSGGGDAFDIAWAVDPATGEPAGLTGFDFIRVTTGVDATSGLFGEKSTEIDALSDVAPGSVCAADINADGLLDAADFNAWLTAFIAGEPAADQDGNGLLNGADFNTWLTNFLSGCP